MIRTPVITGLGFVTSIGNSRREVSSSLRELRHGLAEWNPVAGVETDVRLAGLLRGFDVASTNSGAWSWPAECDIHPSEVRAMPPHCVYALAAVKQALAEAGLEREALTDGATGLYCASGGSPRMTHYHLGKLEASGWTKGHPHCVISSVAGSLNFHLGTLLGIRGGSCSFASACASGSHALGFAADEIRLGRQERVIVVAAEDLNAESLLPFLSMGVLSRSDEPAKAARPFDRGREGFVGTGGAVALVVESAAAAERRKARPMARLAGWGQSCDGHHPALPHPEGRGLAEAMRRALRDAQIAPDKVEHINAHGTGTQAGDRAEAKALRAVFGDECRPAVCSTKALTGHGLSLAGAMEAAFCVLALDEGFIPGQAHLVQPDEDSALLNLPRETANRRPRIVLNNSSGFGGSNVAHVLQLPT
jgi:3-oxoacyl-(acyl-carrier-protein) synthase